MSTFPRRRAPLVLIALLAVAVALPLGAFAAHQFADVSDSNTFHADIDALADSGVTSGCGGENFCPKDAVTREQMAAFLNRLGALAPGKTPVVNADKVDGYQANQVVRIAGASTESLLDGGVAQFGQIGTALSVPGPGLIAITSSAQLYFAGDAGSDTISCRLLLNGQPVPGTFREVDLQYGPGINLDENDCAPSGTATVCAAGAYAVVMKVESVGPQSDVLGGTITAIYTPFDGYGATPAAGACAAVSGSGTPPSPPEKGG